MKDGKYTIGRKNSWHGTLFVTNGITFFPGLHQADFSNVDSETANYILIERGLYIKPVVDNIQ